MGWFRRITKSDVLLEELDVAVFNNISDKPSVPTKGNVHNFEEKVKANCKVKTDSGICVQSKGEKLIADFLYEHHIGFDYDEQITLNSNEKNAKGHTKQWVRPDFYLTEFGVVIEYWGMEGTADYDKKMDWKKRVYKESKQKFISVTPEDLNKLDSIMRTKLSRIGVAFD